MDTGLAGRVGSGLYQGRHQFIIEAAKPMSEEQLQKDPIIDKTGIRTRQFSLGEDLVLADYVGNLGFDEVTDWEYYYQNEEDPNDRKVVQPNPMD